MHVSVLADWRGRISGVLNSILSGRLCLRTQGGPAAKEMLAMPDIPLNIPRMFPVCSALCRVGWW